MRVDILTREYPPYIYGGAGVHVNELASVLRQYLDLRVYAFDGPRKDAQGGVEGFSDMPQLVDAHSTLSVLGVDLEMAAAAAGADLVHSHTWYTNMAGFLAKKLYAIPHVVTAHSLEPMRPWKAEQLGGGYRISSWAEKTAYENADAIVAVSKAMRKDILQAYPKVDPQNVHVIHNGIDVEKWQRTEPDSELATKLCEAWGIDQNRPIVAFVGRITRQKGLNYLLRAAQMVNPEAQFLICAGAADTVELGQEVEGLIEELRQMRSGVIHIEQMLPHAELVTLLSLASVFVTPSIYEPLGIVNLEAMALQLPVVASDTGGIPDVVIDGETGLLVPLEQDEYGTPLAPKQFETDIAERISWILDNPEEAISMGKAGRARVVEHFTWDKIGLKTISLYKDLLASKSKDETNA